MDILLGLVGGKNSGKSIVAEYLSNKYKFAIFSKNDIMRYRILEAADWDFDDVFSNPTKEVNTTMLLLNKYYKNNDPEYFARLLKNQIKESSGNPFRILIPDLSFKEEFDLLFFNNSSFLFNKEITDSGIVVGDYFKYKLLLGLTASFEDDNQYGLFEPDPGDTKKIDLFISGTKIASKYLKSLDIVMKGILKE
jgi:hypothetical protein